MKRILLLLLAAVVTAAGESLRWHYNRTNDTITFQYVEVDRTHYTLVRHDIGNNYTENFTNWNATVSGTNTFTINPNEITPENIETGLMPSGLYWFYIFEQTFPAKGKP